MCLFLFGICLCIELANLFILNNKVVNTKVSYYSPTNVFSFAAAIAPTNLGSNCCETEANEIPLLLETVKPSFSATCSSEPAPSTAFLTSSATFLPCFSKVNICLICEATSFSDAIPCSCLAVTPNTRKQLPLAISNSSVLTTPGLLSLTQRTTSLASAMLFICFALGLTPLAGITA